MARVLWKRLNRTDFNAMSGAAAISPTGGGARHIVLGTSQSGNRVESFLPPLQNNQVTVLTEAGPRWPSASLTFTSNPARRKGEWLIADQKNNRHPAWTTAAGFPSSLDPSNRPVVLVVEVDGVYHVDWRDQQRLSSVAPSIAAADRGVGPAPPALLAELFLQARLSPVDARVVRGQLQYADETTARAASSDQIVDTVREAHLPTAARLATALAGSNAGPGFSARFEAVHDLLRETLTAERALQLAIYVRGLEGMTDAVAERLDEVMVADIGTFIVDLFDLLNQLPLYRRFVEEALVAVQTPADAARAAASIAIALEEQPDDLVEPRLKQAVREIRVVAEEREDRLTAFGLVRTVGNACRAVGRYIYDRFARFGRDATQAFDDAAGKGFGKLLGRAAGVGAALLVLRALFPGEFAFVGQLLRAAERLLL